MASGRRKWNWQNMTTDDWVEWLYEVGCSRLPREETVRNRLRFQYDMLIELFNDWRYVEDAFFGKYPRKARSSWLNGESKVAKGPKEMKAGPVSMVGAAGGLKMPEMEVVKVESACNVTEDAVKADEAKEVATSAAENLSANTSNNAIADVLGSEVEDTEAVESRLSEVEEDEKISDAEGDVSKTPKTEPEEIEDTVESLRAGRDNDSSHTMEESLEVEVDVAEDMAGLSEDGGSKNSEVIKAEDSLPFRTADSRETDQMEKAATIPDITAPWFLRAEPNVGSSANEEVSVTDNCEPQRRRRWSREACLEFLVQARQRLGRDATQPEINTLAREMYGPSYHSIAMCLGSKKIWPKLIDEWIARKGWGETQIDSELQNGAEVQSMENTQSEPERQSDPKENKEIDDQKNTEKADSSELRAWVERTQAVKAGAVSVVGFEINPVVEKTKTEDERAIEEISLTIHGLEVDFSLGDRRMRLKVNFGPAK